MTTTGQQRTTASPPGKAAPRRGGTTVKQSRRRQLRSKLLVHGLLIGYSFVALAPIVMIVMNSLKDRAAIFTSPFSPPTPDTLSLRGYEAVFNRADFVNYFANSITVTLVSVLLTLLLGSMAAFALTEYQIRIAPLLLGYLALGIMIPIRLGTVSLLQL
jgi:raffinose/stachyose/melibiose transport system permease protein